MSEELAKTFHPGEFLQEEMEERGWSVETVAEKCFVKPARIEELLARRFRVTKGMALVLGNAFDTGPEYWSNLQQLYDTSSR